MAPTIGATVETSSCAWRPDRRRPPVPSLLAPAGKRQRTPVGSCHPGVAAGRATLGAARVPAARRAI